jgi:Xaa-Pro aminopeptidase
LDRLNRLFSKIRDIDLDCFIISDIVNIRYLSGFTGSEGWMIVTPYKAFIAVDFRYKEQVKNEVANCEIVAVQGDMSVWLLPLIQDIKPKKVGFEADNLPFSIYGRLKDIIAKYDKSINIMSVSRLIENIRMVKEPEEIDRIIQACKLTDSVIVYAESIIFSGITEKQASWELEKYLRQNGSESIPFEIIIASGINSSLPHASPTNKIISKNEPALIDIGARINGYCSDLSRTLSSGTLNETFNRVYDIVLSAQMTAINIMEAGMTGQQADAISRTVIDKSGYGDYFGHGLGHGVGLAVHELPRLGPNSSDILSDDMVFTIEPGIYIPGWGGIRIEDTVIIKDGKVHSLSNAKKLVN